MSIATAKKFDPTAKTNFTYADYATWPEYPRFELIKGEAFEMAAPSIEHQKISVALTLQFGIFLRGNVPELLVAPTDVRINYDTTDNTVVQPDLLVVCDPKKIDNGKHCLGAPDLVIEISSENSRGYDKLKKLNIYLEAGVREYWIVVPEEKGVEVYNLENGKYFITAYTEGSTIPVHVLPGCEINLNDIFEKDW